MALQLLWALSLPPLLECRVVLNPVTVLSFPFVSPFFLDGPLQVFLNEAVSGVFTKHIRFGAQ